ncbi:MAG: hypothetical protein WC736_15895 [Gallionella sp.]|jgi:hypothetical protein
MGFLSDLGRSNAISSVNTLSNTAIQLKGLQNQDEQRQYENAINLEKLGMLKETHAVDIRQKEIATSAAEAEQKRLNAPYDITTDPRFLALPKEGQDVVLKHAVANKYTDQTGIGTVRSAKQLLSDTEGNPTLFKESMGPLVQAKKNATLEAYKALQDAKTTGDEKKIAVATGLYKNSLAGYNASNGTFLTHANKLDELSAQQAGKIQKGPGGALYQKDEQGNMVELVPPQEKEVKAPTTRNRDVGDKQITEEWKDGAWVKVGEAPRWNDRGGKREDRLAANQQFKNERDMRTDFEKLPEVKNYNEMNIRASQMTQAIEESKKTNNYVAVDQALITMFNKMTDPQSVVRESEYARTSNDIATVNMIKGKAQKVLTGGAGLTNDERTALKVMSDRFLAASKNRYDEVADEYRGLAKTYGYEPNNVVFRGASKKGSGGVKTADEFLKKYGGK